MSGKHKKLNYPDFPAVPLMEVDANGDDHRTRVKHFWQGSLLAVAGVAAIVAIAHHADIVDKIPLETPTVGDFNPDLQGPVAPDVAEHQVTSSEQK